MEEHTNQLPQTEDDSQSLLPQDEGTLWDAIKDGMEDLWEAVESEVPLVIRAIVNRVRGSGWAEGALSRIPLSLRAEIATAVGLEEFSWEGLCDREKVLTAAMVVAKNYPDFNQRREMVNEFLSCCVHGTIGGPGNLRQEIERYREADDNVGVVAARAVVYLMAAKDPAEGLIKILKELSAEDLGVFRSYVALADVLENHTPKTYNVAEFKYVIEKDDIGAMGARMVVYLQKNLKDAVRPMATVFRQLSADGLTRFITLFDSEREEAKKLLDEV